MLLIYRYRVIGGGEHQTVYHSEVMPIHQFQEIFINKTSNNTSILTSRLLLFALRTGDVY